MRAPYARFGLALVCAASLACERGESGATPATGSAATGAAATGASGTATIDLHALASAEEVAGALRDANTRAQLSASLRPTLEDYVALFGGEYGPALHAKLDPAWAASKVQPGPWTPNQSELAMASAPSESFSNDGDLPSYFPRGYRRIARYLQPGFTLHHFRYVRPGEAAGAGYDALVQIEGRWRFFPKPWIAAEAGSKFFVPNPVESLCMELERKQFAATGPFDKCVLDMTRRAEDYGRQGFEAYASCVRELAPDAELSACTPKAAGG